MKSACDDSLINGIIYLITNHINDKQYVGQTTTALEERWRQHVVDSHRVGGNYPVPLVDRAIAKYGEENFSIEVLEHLPNCTRAYLDQRERHWICKYRTCIKEYGKDAGYNVSHGGHSAITLFTAEDEQVIFDMWNSQTSIQSIADEFKVSPIIVRNILRKHGVDTLTPEEVTALQRAICGFRVLCFADDGDIPLHEFASSMLAASWLIDNGYSNSKYVGGVASFVRNACVLGHSAYGFRWVMPQMSAEEQELRRMQVQRNSSRYDAAYKAKLLERGIAEGHRTHKKCPICGTEIRDESTYCHRHSHYMRSDYNPDVMTINGHDLSRDEITQLLRFNSWEAIGKMYGVTGNAVKKAARRTYGIVVNRRTQYRLWNAEFQCYEYLDTFPLSQEEITSLNERGILLQTVIRDYRISKETWNKYRSRIEQEWDSNKR